MSTTHDIIATIGPASLAPSTLVKLAEAGMTIARVNASWGTLDDVRAHVRTVQGALSGVPTFKGVMVDLPGPRVQTGGSHHIAVDAGNTLTDRDIACLQVAIEEHCPYVAVSFVGTAAPLEQARTVAFEAGASVQIIAKIERTEALEHLGAIIDAADMVMVARGDLGQAVPIEEVPFVQHDIIKKALAMGKPVIVATEMLYSMTAQERPTRAEVSDVTLALIEGARGVMLSEETASGKYPLLTVKAMKRIVSCAESHMSV